MLGLARFKGSALGIAVGVAASIAALGSSPVIAASDTVDLALVLAVDVSISMDSHEREIQRRGYASAFRDRELIRAFTSGFHGRIAVSYFEWGGDGDQTVLIDWTLIDGQAAAEAVADRLDHLPRGKAHYTALGDALNFAGQMIARSPYPARRQVIDVSGDGVNNEGLRVDIARDLITERGIVINGLPLLLEPDGRITILDVPNLDLYYEDCVIGGPGAFSLPVRRARDLAEAIRTKLLLEVAGASNPLVRIAAKPARIACDVGERRRRRPPQIEP